MDKLYPGKVVPMEQEILVIPPNPEFVAAALEVVRANAAAISANAEVIRTLTHSLVEVKRA